MPFLKSQNGFYISIKVTSCTNSNKIGDIITINNKKYLKIFITATPHHNKANEALVSLLSKKLHTAKSNICIKTGKKTKIKIVYVDNITDVKHLTK